MKLINEAEAAEMLGVKQSTLRTWRSTRKGPPWAKIEGAVRYVDLEHWVAAQTVVDPDWCSDVVGRVLESMPLSAANEIAQRLIEGVEIDPATRIVRVILRSSDAE